MPVDASLNRLAVTAGQGLDGGDLRGAALDAEYADRVGIEPGDRLRLQVAGRAFSVRVRGLARSPEYLLATANPDYLVPQRGSLAVVFLPRASLQRLTGLDGRANDLAVDLPGGGNGAGREAARRRAADGSRHAALAPVRASADRGRHPQLLDLRPGDGRRLRDRRPAADRAQPAPPGQLAAARAGRPAGDRLPAARGRRLGDAAGRGARRAGRGAGDRGDDRGRAAGRE